jgi:competence protein ComEC
LEVGDFWHTSIDRPEPLFEELRQAVKARNIHDHVAIRGAELTQGDFCRMTVLNPIGTPSGRSSLASSSGTFLNNASVVTQLFCGRHTILFAADIETEGLHHLTAFGQDPVTVLKVPHHGARSSLSREWIEQVRPRFAVFSVGRNNSYGHPVRDVVEAYSAVGSDIARTDLDGAIIVTGRLSTSDLHVRRMRDLVLQPVQLHACFWTCEWNNWYRVWAQWYEF